MPQFMYAPGMSHRSPPAVHEQVWSTPCLSFLICKIRHPRGVPQGAAGSGAQTTASLGGCGVPQTLPGARPAAAILIGWPADLKSAREGRQCFSFFVAKLGRFFRN